MGATPSKRVYCREAYFHDLIDLKRYLHNTERHCCACACQTSSLFGCSFPLVAAKVVVGLQYFGMISSGVGTLYNQLRCSSLQHQSPGGGADAKGDFGHVYTTCCCPPHMVGLDDQRMPCGIPTQAAVRASHGPEDHPVWCVLSLSRWRESQGRWERFKERHEKLERAKACGSGP